MNSPLPFMSDEEILLLVKPLTQKAAIMRWFRNNGFPDVKPKPNGLPLIFRSAFDAAPAAVNSGSHSQTSAQPNVLEFRLRYGNKSKSQHQK